jgi:hypothetical protein
VTGVTTTTPPGWYPEPGHTGNGPALERWWDGNKWTEYTRTAPTDARPVYPGYPADQLEGGYFPPGGRRRRTSTVVIAVVAALVVVGGVIAGVLTLGGNSKSTSAAATPTPSPSAPGSQGSPGPGQTPGLPGGPGGPGGQGTPSAGGPPVDAYDGIRLPVPNGWQGTPGAQGVGANISVGTYTCPGNSGQSCTLGGAYSAPAAALKLTSTTAQAAAKEDIAKNAAESYSTSIYGATTSHQEVGAQAVTVAGKQGYYVRWKLQTASGTGGYVESLAFPSPADSTKLVVVRFGFDISSKAPGLDVMDQITQGIKADSSGGTGSTGGTGI